MKKKNVERARKRGIFTLIIIGIAIMIVGVSGYEISKSVSVSAQPSLFSCVTSVNYHIHAHLSIVMQGSPLTVPALIGYQGGCWLPMHTHDTSGTVHIEAPYDEGYTILNFFQIWRSPLNGTIISVSHCSISPNLTISACGPVSIADSSYVILNGDNITVSYR